MGSCWSCSVGEGASGSSSLSSENNKLDEYYENRGYFEEDGGRRRVRKRVGEEERGRE